MTALSTSQCLALYLTKGFGSATLKSLLDKPQFTKLFTMTQPELQALGLSQHVAAQIISPDTEKISHILATCEQQHITLVDYFSPHYPEQLKHISHAPLVLFCKGRIELLQQPQIAIVGSRSATASGLEIAAEFAYQLTQSGIAVTSGLARGIDGAAHKGALSGSGDTIAVLGTGVDVIYPKRHRLLYQHIVEQGVVVSEFLPGTAANSKHFPRRNRIISGLSLGTLLVEAEIKSGSLITAKYALEQNKEVFAIPGSIRNPLSAGCHFLIKQGAKLTENVADILEEVGFLSQSGLYNKESSAKITEQEECPVLQNLGFEVTSIETLTHRTQWPVEQVLTRLLDLELEDKVARVLDGYIKLARG